MKGERRRRREGRYKDNRERRTNIGDREVDEKEQDEGQTQVERHTTRQKEQTDLTPTDLTPLFPLPTSSSDVGVNREKFHPAAARACIVLSCVCEPEGFQTRPNGSVAEMMGV